MKKRTIKLALCKVTIENISYDEIARLNFCNNFQFSSVTIRNPRKFVFAV